MSKTLIHTVEQPDSDITAFILSCNRLDLLDQTIQSFLNTRDLITKTVILDDSGLPEVFDTLVSRYGSFADIICFPRNRGIFWAKDFMTSFCDTKYIFYIEDDWKFLNTGYLQVSKNILEKHRDIGSIDLSWRTFEEQGFDSYIPELVDDTFYYKKPWRISPNHFHWFIWQGSPNLKRREDLVLLGRTEECPNEWSIDRKFFSLGFKGVFVKDRFVTHLGDHRSIMVDKRHQESESPKTLYPKHLESNRIMPILDYHDLDQHALNMRHNTPDMRSNQKVFVTSLLDIGRESVDNRNFEKHYVEGLQKIIDTGFPVFAFVDQKYYESLLAKTGGKPVCLWPISKTNVASYSRFKTISDIARSPSWYQQSDWMSNSIIRSPLYLTLTHLKIEFLFEAIRFNAFNAQQFFWIDSGICNSFNIDRLSDFPSFNNLKTESDQILISRFGYYPDPEIHGFNRQGYNELCGGTPSYVYRASVFGGTSTAIQNLSAEYTAFLDQALSLGYLGTEEAILSGIAIRKPELFQPVTMPNGDIKNFLR